MTVCKKFFEAHVNISKKSVMLPNTSFQEPKEVRKQAKPAESRTVKNATGENIALERVVKLTEISILKTTRENYYFTSQKLDYT